MADIIKLHDPETKAPQYPVTMDSAVLCENGATVKDTLAVALEKVEALENALTEIQAQSSMVFDVTYSDGTESSIRVYGNS